MESRRYTGLGNTLLPFVFFLIGTCLLDVIDGQINRKVGVQFLSYINKEGKLADGTCCDGQTQADGTCVPDQCDTAFSLCFRHHAVGSVCDPPLDTTAITDNNTVTTFGSRIGVNSNDTTSLTVLPLSTMEDIIVEVDVLEVDPGKNLLGNFSLRIDWTDLYTTTPDWHHFSFDNALISLELNVTAFCSKYYYGPSCNINCRPYNNSRFGHYTCDNNGTKHCLPGWEDPANNCKSMIDFCLSQPCQNNATCTPVLLSYICDCPANYTGRNCETLITASESGSDDDGVSVGVIAGPIIGLLLLAAGSLLGFLLYRRKKREPVAPEKLEENPEENGPVEPQKGPPKEKSQIIHVQGEVPPAQPPAATQNSQI